MVSDLREASQKNYGFVINNRNCIGCHACSTACKSENQVPLGVYRTWVKYTEVGEYPESRRHFQVTRCNHCANPPCVRICPVTAMYQRDDGIVEFDSDICIGCKACMQACPYDAIHIDPDTGTAAKCHYCSHRTDIGLEPACVVVCPTHAIIAGDMNDPESEISRVLAGEQVTVRKPEQGTSPKLFYIEGNDTAMHPTAAERTPQSYMWADVQPLHGRGPLHISEHSVSLGTKGPVKTSDEGTPLRATQSQGVPDAGPIQLGLGRVASHMVQVGYNAQHKIPWHWPVPAYLVTKGMGSGIFLIMAWASLTGSASFSSGIGALAALASVGLFTITTALLIYDLERPERFFRIILRPQWNSWLTRGTVFLIGISTIGGLWFGLEALSWMGLLSGSTLRMIRPWLLGVGSPFALGAAVYTAFLFGQCEGRDLWQGSLLPVHLGVQAIMMGGATLGVMALIPGLPSGLESLVSGFFALMLVIDLGIMIAETVMPHASEVAAQAGHAITHGRYKKHFWQGGILLGHVIPLALLLTGSSIALGLAGICAIAGLYFYEYAFVMAPQEVPNS